MSTSSPARLYCTLVGAVLVIAGIIGFFYSSGFDTGTTGVAKDTDEVFGILGVNGWHNVVHILLGLLALVAAATPYGARMYCLGIGLVYPRAQRALAGTKAWLGSSVCNGQH